MASSSTNPPNSNHPHPLMISPCLLTSLEKINKRQEEFLSCTHGQLLRYLQDDPVGVDEYDLFLIVTRWARKRFELGKAVDRTTIPTVEELRMLIAPAENQEDLMGLIRFPLFTLAEWDSMWASNDIGLIPLKVIYARGDLKKYLDSTDERVRQEIRNMQHMKGFDFRHRGTPAVVENCSESSAGGTNNISPASAEPRSSTSYGDDLTLSGDNSGTSSPLGDPRGQQRFQPCDHPSSSSTSVRPKIEALSSSDRDGKRLRLSQPGIPVTSAATQTMLDELQLSQSFSEHETSASPHLASELPRTTGPSQMSTDLLHQGCRLRSIQIKVEPAEIPSILASNSASIPAGARTAVTSDRESEEDGPETSVSGSPPATAQVETENDRIPARVNPQPSTSTGSSKVAMQTKPGSLSEYFKKLDDMTRKITLKVEMSLNIKHEDLKTEVGRYLPHLKEFHLKFIPTETKPQQNKLNDRFKEFVVNTIDLKKLICFSTKLNETGKTELRDLWESGVNVSLEFHGCIVLKMYHRDMKVVINTPKDALEILEGLKDVPLKKLFLGYCQLTDQLDFSKVVKLIFYRVKGVTVSFNDILSKCVSVVELVLYKNEVGKEPVNLTSLKHPQKLRWLTLSKTDISATTRDKNGFPHVLTLHLNHSTCSKSLIADLPKMFPSIKKLSVGELDYPGTPSARCINLEFILSILTSCKHLSWIRVLGLDWDSKSSQGRLKTRFSDLMASKKSLGSASFILSRQLRNVPKWKRETLDGLYSYMSTRREQEQEVEIHMLDNFYNSFSDEVPAWKTFAHFHIHSDDEED